MAAYTKTSRKSPPEDENICCPCSMDMPLRFVRPGKLNRSKGSKASRATSIGDIDVASVSLVLASKSGSWLGASRFVSAPNASGGWLSHAQASNSANCSGFSIQGACQWTVATRFVCWRRRSANSRDKRSACSGSLPRTLMRNSRALVKCCWYSFKPCTVGSSGGNRLRMSTSNRSRQKPSPTATSNRAHHQRFRKPLTAPGSPSTFPPTFCSPNASRHPPHG